MKYLTFFISILILPAVSGLSAASDNLSRKMTIQRFLYTAYSDYRLKNQQEIISYLEDAPTSTPYLDKIEFRTRTDDFHLSEQEYALRFYPKGWGETEYTQKLMEDTRRSNQIEYDAYFHDALRQRYDLILSFCETQAAIKLKQDLLTACEDRIRILRKKSRLDLNFEMETLIEAEDQEMDLQLDLIKLNNRFVEIQEQIRSAAQSNDPVFFPEDEILSIETVAEVVRDLKEEPAIDNIHLRDQQARLALSKTKLQLEKAKGRDYFRFLEVAYDTDESDEPQKAVSIQLGFRLPFVNADQDDVNRRKIACMKERLQYETDIRKIAEKAASLTSSLEKLIHQYHILAERAERGNPGISLRTYRNIKGMNPLTLLKMKESVLTCSVQRNQVRYAILKRYLELLYVKGKLLEAPMKNHLSGALETIG